MKLKFKLLASTIALTIFLVGSLSSGPALANGVATSVRSLGISTNAVPCSALEQELNSKSYFQALCLKQPITAGKKPKYYKAVNKRYKVDAVLVQSGRGKDRTLEIINLETGRSIVQFSSSETRTAETLATAIMAAFPYRGFVTAVRGDEVELNLGTRHGLKTGVYLNVFEIGSGDASKLNSSKRKLGTIVVTVAGERSSTAQIVSSSGTIAKFAKIDHEDAKPPEQSALVATASPSRMWISLGSELRTIKTTAKDPQGANRAYTMSLTPFVTLGIGKAKWNANVLYGYASDDAESLSYLSIQGAYLIRSSGTFSSGTTLAVGGWLSQYNAAAKQTTSNQVLQDFSRYAPYVEYRYQKVIKNLVLGATGELVYPIVTSDQGIGNMLQSFSLGVIPSARLKVNEWLMLEGGFRLQHISVSIKSDTSTSENHTGPFLKGLLLF